MIFIIEKASDRFMDPANRQHYKPHREATWSHALNAWTTHVESLSDLLNLCRNQQITVTADEIPILTIKDI